ncbi:MAG: hypothetical protein WED07_14075 [Candidatus Freyarchaeum deiterrae]
MTKRQRIEFPRTVRLNLLYWLYFWNPICLGLSFVGLIVSFIYSNPWAVTAFGLGLVTSLCLEVWRSYLKLKYNKANITQKAQDREKD